MATIPGTSAYKTTLDVTGPLKVETQFSPFYNYIVLEKYSELKQKTNTVKKNKFKKEFASKYEEKVPDEKVEQSIERINNLLTGIEDVNNEVQNSFTIKQLGVLDYKYCENDLFNLVKKDDTLVILPDYTESDVSTFSDYIEKSEMKDTIKSIMKNKYDKLEQDYKDKLNDQIFYLKVVTKNKRTNETLETTVLEQIEELDRFIQNRLTSEHESRRTGRSSQKKAFKKVIYLTDNEGNWSLHHFSREKYNKSVIPILKKVFDSYVKNSKRDDSTGIQKKEFIREGKSGVRIPSYFKMSFKEVFREKSNEKYAIVTHFEHFVLTEEIKGIFDPAYIKSYAVDDKEKRSTFEVVYKYDIDSTKSPYLFDKIVLNTSKTYILEISILPEFVISGYFQGRSKHYKFKITKINPKMYDPDLEFFIELYLKYDGKYSEMRKERFRDHKPPSINDFYRNVSKETVLLKIIKEPSLGGFGIDKIEELDDFFASTDQTRLNDHDVKIQKCLDLLGEGNTYYDSLKKIMQKNNSLQMKVYKKKNDKMHNFKLLDMGDDFVYQGVLKEYEAKNYYKKFNTSLIDTNLNPKKELIYYDDMKITNESLFAYLSSKSMSTGKIATGSENRKQFILEKELLVILSDTTLLNDLYNFTSTDFPDLILEEKAYSSEREIKNFKYEVLEGIIDIIFHVGTSFYVSRVSSKATTNKVTTRGFSSYEISDIDDIIILTPYTEPPYDSDGVVNEYFADYKKYVSSEANINAPESGEDLYDVNESEKRMNDKRFYLYQDYRKDLQNMVPSNKKSEYLENDTKSIVFLHFDLIYHKDVQKINNCASRKKRIANSTGLFFDGIRAAIRQFTRKNKPKPTPLNKRGGGKTRKIKKKGKKYGKDSSGDSSKR